jgi:hypothetical protein
LLTSLTIGLTSAFILTLIITIWEWIENPSGIFHNGKGTNWTFVYDTAISWFVPTFINVTVISAIVYFLFIVINHFYKSKM